MGNLEEPLTVDTGTGKCGANSTRCFQFRAPPEYAAHLRDAGFDLLNQANNHGYDYGPKGYQNTQRALEKYDLEHTGAPDEITVVDVKGVKVAVAGFSSYVWSNSLVDIAAAKKVVAKAAAMADLVVVQVHMGGEGADKTRVEAGHRDVPRREPGRPGQVLPRDDRRRRGPDRRARPARAARHGVLPGPADRVQPRQLRRWRQLAEQQRSARLGRRAEGVAQAGRQRGPAARSPRRT